MIPGYPPVLQALIASLFTWGVTALGAALVFILPSNSKKVLDVSLGTASGIMTAASFWSLLAPAIEIAEAKFEQWAFLPVAVGFALGAGFVELSDHFIPSCVNTEMSLINVFTEHSGTNDKRESREVQSERMISEPSDTAVTAPRNDPDSQSFSLSWRRLMLLITAVTVHNIPEGMAVGVGFASIGKTNVATFERAFNLALGIGLQNFPEGLAVSLPLSGFGYPKWKAFFYGQLSGMVEPFAAVLGSALVIFMEPILPYALSFASGAMMYVVYDSLIHEAGRNGNEKLASASAIFGFIVMMSLDVGLA